MPVTVFPSPEKTGFNRDATVTTDAALLRSSSRAWTIENPEYDDDDIQTNKKIGKEDRRVLQSSFEHGLEGKPIIPYGNGFVHGVIRAFNQDLNLVLRPDDIWLAILTQFNMYVNGHAEELRPFFVQHDRKKELNIDIRPFSLFDADMGELAHAMVKEIEKNVTDTELQKWMIPTFSTTTSTDIAVASFVMMGSLQKYFEYTVTMGCGFPSVTLLGKKDDWEAIADRVERLHRYGTEAKEWGSYLTPVMRAMVRTFDDPHSKNTKDFWLCAGYKAGWAGSGGIATLSGWITAFCFWDDKGNRNRAYSRELLDRTLEWAHLPFSERRPFALDGVEYPMFDPESLPTALITVPLTLEDHATETKYTATVVAGQVGMTLANEQATVQPRSGWWMLEDSAEIMKPNGESGV